MLCAGAKGGSGQFAVTTDGAGHGAAAIAVADEDCAGLSLLAIRSASIVVDRRADGPTVMLVALAASPAPARVGDIGTSGALIAEALGPRWSCAVFIIARLPVDAFLTTAPLFVRSFGTQASRNPFDTAHLVVLELKPDFNARGTIANPLRHPRESASAPASAEARRLGSRSRSRRLPKAT